MNTERKVKQVIADYTHNTVYNRKKLGDDLGIDSLDSIELIMDLEKTFDIDLSDKTVNNYLGDDWKKATVGKVVHMIQWELED